MIRIPHPFNTAEITYAATRIVFTKVLYIEAQVSHTVYGKVLKFLKTEIQEKFLKFTYCIDLRLKKIVPNIIVVLPCHPITN